MRILRTLCLLAGLALLGSAPALAQQVTEYPIDELTYPELPDFEIPEATRVELGNGLVVFLIEDHELPVISASARIRAGSVYEPADKVGLASITGQVMRTGGTEALTSDELNVLLEGLGANVETGIGATSGTAYMTTLSENLGQVLPVFVDVLTRPRFAQEQVDIAKTQQKSAIARRNDDPQSIAYREFDKLLYGPESPYARTTEYWTIDAISRDDLVAFHEQYYVPNNTLLSVWGDFQTDEMVAMLEEAFADWQPDTALDVPPLPEPEIDRAASVNFIPKEDVTQSTVLMGHLGAIDRTHPDYFATIVMNEVLSGGFTSRLFNTVRTDLGLAYAVFGQYSAGYDRPGEFFAGTFTKSESTVQAAEAMMEVIASMQTTPPTDEEMQLAKDSYLNSFVFNFDTRPEIVGRLMTYEAYGYPMDFLEQTKEGVEAVQTEDVQRVAQTYLHPDQMTMLVLGRAGDFDAPLTTLADEVNEIDITIPTTPPSAEADAPVSEEDQQRGRALLDEAIAALGGADAFAAVEALRMESESTIRVQEQEMSMETDVLMAYPDQMRVTQSLPMGQITVIKNGDTIMLQTPQGTMPAPPQVQQQLATQRWRDLVYLLSHADEVEVSYVGQETVQDAPAEVLRITPPAGAPFQLFLDPATQRPVAMAYQGSNPMSGAPVQARDVMSDYREVGALTLPYAVTTYHDGEPAGSTTTQTIEVNPSIPSDAFDTDM